MLELRARAAWAGQLWVGPYSRFGWSHPGPLLFYLLLPGYRLSEGASASLYLTAALMNLLCALGLLWIGARVFCNPLVRAAGLLLFGLLLLYLIDLLPPTALTAIWNPLITLLPYTLFILICALLAWGRWWALPPALFLHGLILQSHLSYTITATVALFTALVLAISAQRQAKGAPAATTGDPLPIWPWRPLAVSTLLAALVWLPPFWDQWHGTHNLTSICRFFLDATPHGLPPMQALLHGLNQLSRPLLPDLLFDRFATLVTLAGALLLTAQAFFLLRGYRRANRLKRKLPAALCLLCLVQLPAALLSALRLEDQRILHPTYWFGILTLWGWFAVAAAFLSGSKLTAKSAGGWKVPALAALLLALLAALQIQALRDGYCWLAGPGQDDARITAALTDRIAPVLAGKTPPPLMIRSHDTWGIYAGILLQLEKRGLAPVADASWGFMFGPGRAYSKGAKRALELSLQKRRDQLQLATADRYHVYLTQTMRQAEPPPAEALFMDGHHIVPPDPARRALPPVAEGQPWNSPSVTILSGPDAAVFYELAGGILQSASLTADNNDHYELAGAATLTGRFLPLGSLPPVPAPGLRTRALQLPNPRAWRFLRLAPGGGDGSFSIAALQPALGSWGLGLVRWRGVEGEPSNLVNGSPPASGAPITHPQAVRLSEGNRSAILFSLPLVPVAGVAILADGNDRYLIEGTYDGHHFQPLGAIPAVPAYGLQWRPFYFNDARLWQGIRISPQGGDGLYALGQVAPLPVAGQVCAPGSAFSRPALGIGWSFPEHTGINSWAWVEGTEATLKLYPLPGEAHDLLLLARPLNVQGEKQVLEVWAAGVRLAEHDMYPHLATYHQVLPAALAQAPLTLTLHFRYAKVPPAKAPAADQRQLAASISQIQLRPLDL